MTKPTVINVTTSNDDTLKTQLWVIVVAVMGPVILVLILCNVVVCCKFRQSKNRKLWVSLSFCTIINVHLILFMVVECTSVVSFKEMIQVLTKGKCHERRDKIGDFQDLYSLSRNLC